MKNIYLILTSVFFQSFSSAAFSQPVPEVKFNHLYVMIDVDNMKSMRENQSLKDNLAAVQTRTTHADGGEHWTGTYLYGLENYLEFLDTSSYTAPLGACGIGLSVDRPGQLKELKTLLQKSFRVEELHRKLKIKDGSEIPWFEALVVSKNSGTISQEVWIMEYQPSFFEYIGRNVTDYNQTRKIYLQKFDSLRQHKAMTGFTGVTMKLSMEELEFFEEFFFTLNYKMDGDRFLGPDGFRYTLVERKKDDKKTITEIEFEAYENVRKEKINISKNIVIELDASRGFIRFR